jgi:hypothetical protein
MDSNAVPGMAVPIALPDRTSRCCDLPRMLCHLAARSLVPLGHSPLGHYPTHARGTVAQVHVVARRLEAATIVCGGRSSRSLSVVVATSRCTPQCCLAIHSLVGVFAPHMRLPTRHTITTRRLGLSLPFCLPADNTPTQHATRRQNGVSRWKGSHLFMGCAEKLERDRQGSSGSFASRADLMHACSLRPCTSTSQRAIAATASLVFTHSSLDAVTVCHAPGRHPSQRSTTLPFPGMQGVGSTSRYHKPRLVIGLSRDVCPCTVGTFVICTIAVRG